MDQRLLDDHITLCDEMYVAIIQGQYRDSEFRKRINAMYETLRKHDGLISVKLAEILADMRRLSLVQPGGRRFRRIRAEIDRKSDWIGGEVKKLGV